MCGILCCITPLKPDQVNQGKNGLSNLRDSEPEPSATSSCPFCTYRLNQELEVALTDHLLRNRGPNISHEECIATPNSFQVHLSGHVLWTQGPDPISQPIVSGLKYFLFNGDIYSFGPHSAHQSNDVDPPPLYNDGQQLFDLLANCNPAEDQAAHFINIIGNLEGPFAFIFYDGKQNQLWFGRDFFGRQSLLISATKKSSNRSLVFSSVSAFPNTIEIPTSGLFCYDLEKNEMTSYFWKCYERKQVNEYCIKFHDYLTALGIKLNVNQSKNVEIAGGLTTKLKPPIISGPESYSLEKQLMRFTGEDLMQVLHHVTGLLSDKIDQLLIHLRRSVKRRMLTTPPFCKKCIETLEPCSHSKVGILFSGGLDSMVLAYLAAEILANSNEHKEARNKPSIDLINVAFFQDQHHSNLSFDGSSFTGHQKMKIPIPPDRITGREAHAILNQMFESDGVSLNFIEVNVPKSRVSSVRETKLRHLISPLTSVLDDSLGCCLWFAAEATSILSNARILLLGSGADELFGGYGRHRSAYESKGWAGLSDEMQLEIDRISVRNMGRDNRVVSDHGVSPRLPFLDENVVRFVTQECDLWEKCCPLKTLTNTNGTDNCYSLGDKILLRATAMKLLRSRSQDSDAGTHLALFPKRAMQFGSRIAKLENSKEKGGDECRRLIHK